MTKKTTRDEEDICSKKSQRIQAIRNIAKLVKKSGLNSRAGPVLPETEKPTVLTQILENRNRYGTEI